MALVVAVDFVDVVKVVSNWPAIARRLVMVNVAGNDFKQTQGQK